MGYVKEDMTKMSEGSPLYNTPFEAFRHSIVRAWALLALQDSLEELAAWTEEEGGSFFGMLGKRSPLGLKEIFNIIDETMKSVLPEVEKRMEEELQKKKDEINKHSKKIKDISEDDLTEAFRPLIEFICAMREVLVDPLYYDAVVSAVTAFETYLKDTLVLLISHNKQIEGRFYKELQEGITYDKIKTYDYDWDSILGYVVADNIRFHDLDNVDETFKKAFNKTQKRWSIFRNKKAKQKIQQFIEVRHLIVHNAGFVDHHFKKKTGCELDIYEPYPLEREEIEAIMLEMLKTAEKIEKTIKEHEYILLPEAGPESEPVQEG